MTYRRYARILVSVLIAMLVLVSSFAVVNAQDDTKVLRSTLGPGDIPSLDPALATDTSSHQVIQMTFIGLTTQDEVTLETETGMATDWTVADDGVTYTFNLMEGVPWVTWDEEAGEVVEVTDEEGNVRYVTAQDFEYGYKRVLDPETAADYSYVTAEWVEGGAAFNAGEGAREDVQVTAIDDYTLEVVASDEAGFVPAVLGLWFNAAQPQWAIEEHGDQWTEPENYNQYGPFVVREWVHDESITLVKNPFWPGTEDVPQAKLDEVQLFMLDESAALSNFEAGEVDHVITVPLSDIDRVRVEYADEYVNAPRLCSYYYGFNIEKEPLDNVHLRRALSASIQRDLLVENVTKGGERPAQWFSNPALAAAPTMEDNPDVGIGTDLEMAQEELNLALEDMGLSSVDELPTITLMHNESEGHARIAEAIQQMWTENLGLDIQISTQEWAVYLETLNEDPPQIFRLGWCADYPDAHNFASDVFRSTSGNNHTNYASEEYDALVDEAKALRDLEARQDLYAQAENMLSREDAAIAPIYWYALNQLTATNVERTVSKTGTQRYEKWDIQ